jgi:hypothetical protein
LKEQEENTFLSRVKYDVFWGKVKLVGYTMKLRPDHMRLIAEAINLKYDEKIQSYYPSVEKSLLCDPEFGFKDGEHDPHKMLLTGFMYCEFAKNETAHMDNLWHLINPNFKSTVPIQAIRDTIADLLYIAID